MTDDPKTMPAPEQAFENLDDLIEHWWTDHFPGSPVARDTAAWNVAHAAKEALKRLLRSPQGLPAATADKDLQRSIR